MITLEEILEYGKSVGDRMLEITEIDDDFVRFSFRDFPDEQPSPAALQSYRDWKSKMYEKFSAETIRISIDTIDEWIEVEVRPK